MENKFQEQVNKRLNNIYGENLPDSFAERLCSVVLGQVNQKKSNEKWTEQDVVLISYGDSIVNKTEPALKVLQRFLKKHLNNTLSFVHILPFYPYTSDDGFSVVDYKKVNPELGSWEDIHKIGEDYKLMFDLVINHISQKSTWFQNYLQNKHPGKDYFIDIDPEVDLSKVVRPRSLPLLTPLETANGKKFVWTTFSDDQVDLNFSNPELLLEMVKVLLHYLSNGASMIRMDAIAFLWKEIGTSCLHLPQTHEVVKLLRDIMEKVDPSSILLTETNVPNKENLSYFGNGDEADMVYQFSLPPLLLHALYSSNSAYFNEWAKSIPKLANDCTFFNFTASHDGIGVRPLEGLLPDDELKQLIEGMKASGGKISTRRNSDGSDSAYEMNITYFDALKRTGKGEDYLQVDRFICSQTIMMELQGIPAFYIHSLLATRNYIEGLEQTGRARTINRRKWEEVEIEQLLANKNHHSTTLNELKRRIGIRKNQKAFHPDGEQEVLDFGKNVIALKRVSPDRVQEICCISNISDTNLAVNLDGFPQFDLLRQNQIRLQDRKFMLKPYETLWLAR